MKLLTTRQAAEILRISERRVRAMIAEGTIVAHKLGREYAIEESKLSTVKVYRRPGRPSATTAKEHK